MGALPARRLPIQGIVVPTENAVSETLTPNLTKSEWIDRCMTSLGKLKPELSVQEAQTVAQNILWCEDTDEVPEQVAAAWACDD